MKNKTRRTRRTKSQLLKTMRKIERMVSSGKTVTDSCKACDTFPGMYYTWRKAQTLKDATVQTFPQAEQTQPTQYTVVDTVAEAEKEAGMVTIRMSRHDAWRLSQLLLSEMVNP